MEKGRFGVLCSGTFVVTVNSITSKFKLCFLPQYILFLFVTRHLRAKLFFKNFLTQVTQVLFILGEREGRRERKRKRNIDRLLQIDLSPTELQWLISFQSIQHI